MEKKADVGDVCGQTYRPNLDEKNEQKKVKQAN